MTAPAPPSASPSAEDATPAFTPYVPDRESPRELTLRAVLLGTVLGIIFGASSLYLFLKVGMTVSASIPVAVLAITIFRALSGAIGSPRATILENNIVQTAGSAGESIAFGVGATMPALMILGYDMEPSRVMIVSVLGGILGILMMIPLRKAFIVKQHGTLPYPEGTACAKILVAGEQGGANAKTVFAGFGLAFVYQTLMEVFRLWPKEPAREIAGIKGYEKAVFTGRKVSDKVYFRHTGYPGGIKETTPKRILEGRFPERVVEKAIERMLPRGPLARRQLANLRVYPGPDHPHAAQNPEVVDVGAMNRKNRSA